MKSLLAQFALQARIGRLKRAARRHYLAYDAMRDRYDCGLSMALQINPHMGWDARRFNAAMTQLARIDSDCPKWSPLATGDPRTEKECLYLCDLCGEAGKEQSK